MMVMSKQQQSGGDHSINVQATEVSVGLSYSDARQVALDVFQANVIHLTHAAAVTAEQRVRRFVDDYLSSLQQTAATVPEIIDEMSSPDMQYAILTAERGYARSGDDELAALLVQLLVDRTKERRRSLLQIVLNESLRVAPLLTTEQMNALSVAFVLRSAHRRGVTSPATYLEYLDGFILPFVHGLSTNRSEYDHLVFAGCGMLTGADEIPLEEVWRRTYPSAFCKGFLPVLLKLATGAKEFKLVTSATEMPDPRLVPCYHDDLRLQFAVEHNEDIEEFARGHRLSAESADQLTKLQTTALMENAEIRSFIIGKRPVYAKLAYIWDASLLKGLTLTSVGIAIGNANLQRVTGMKFDLSIWLESSGA